MSVFSTEYFKDPHRSHRSIAPILGAIGKDLFLLDKQGVNVSNACPYSNIVKREIGEKVTVLVAKKDFREISQSSTGCYINIGGEIRGGGGYHYYEEYKKGDMLPMGEYLHNPELWEVSEAVVVGVKPPSPTNGHTYYTLEIA